LLAETAAVIGLVLGRLWDARSESSRWRRDQKTASYRRLAEAFIVLYENIRSVPWWSRTQTHCLTQSTALDATRPGTTHSSWYGYMVASRCLRCILDGSCSNRAFLCCTSTAVLYRRLESGSNSIGRCIRNFIAAAREETRPLACFGQTLSVHSELTRIWPWSRATRTAAFPCSSFRCCSKASADEHRYRRLTCTRSHTRSLRSSAKSDVRPGSGPRTT
jgi:hypothetical protein